MTTLTHRLNTLLAVTALVLPAMANATQPGVYLGAGIGTAEDEILQETSGAAKLFGGLNITRFIGVEVAFINLGDYVNGAIEQDGLEYSLVGYLPLNYHVDLFGKIGMFNWEVRSGPYYVQGTDPAFGAGINVMLNPNVDLRGEWQLFTDVDGGDVDLYSASVSLHF